MHIKSFSQWLGESKQGVESYRAQEQAELSQKIPNIENYKVGGKVDKGLITDKNDLEIYNKIYAKYDALITPLLEAKSTTETEFEVLQSLHKLGLVDSSELIAYKYIISGSTGVLDLSGTPIQSLPAGLTVGRSLYLRDTQIAELPDGLKVGGGLDLRDTPITELPAGLRVDGGLDLLGTPIAELPADLSVGRFLDLRGTPIAKKYSHAQLKKMFPGVKGTIFI